MPRTRIIWFGLALPFALMACGTSVKGPVSPVPGIKTVARSQAFLPSPDVCAELELALRERPDFVKLRGYRSWNGRDLKLGAVKYFCGSYYRKDGLVYVSGYLKPFTDPLTIVYTQVLVNPGYTPGGCE